MQSLNLLPLALAFFEGLVLIISPCILPILPIILSGALEGGKRRPFGIILGFILTFSLFTLFARQLVQYAGVDLSILRMLSFVVLIAFGVVMLSNRLTEKFSRATDRVATFAAKTQDRSGSRNGFFSGLLFGCLVGLVWTPCAGPILAAVIVQTIIQESNFMSALTILCFAIGAGVPMLLIALLGKRILTSVSLFRHHAILIRKMLGLIIILSVIYIAYSDLMLVPADSASAENSSPAMPVSETPPPPNATATVAVSTSLQDALSHPYPAPPLAGIEGWINSEPFTLSDLRGKVVLIDFWAYSCINCIRTLPYLVKWYDTYQNKGFVIVGVHSPEFAFEADAKNVKRAVEKYQIRYPVVLDNQFSTWRNFSNHYWPAHYLIDKTGQVVYQHFGEGKYDVTENNIQALLAVNLPITSVENVAPHTFDQTPEIYLGYQRTNLFSGASALVHDSVHAYQYPEGHLARHHWALSGEWMVKGENIVAHANRAAIRLHFHAGQVYAVLGTQNSTPVNVQVLLNGKLVLQHQGKDVKQGLLTVAKHDLYHLLDLQQLTDREGVLELVTASPGLEIYTFTFGQ